MSTFLALRCCACESFQVRQKTQQKRFTCVLCGEKQTITRVFSSGTAKEVRAVVQQLNLAR